MHTLLPACVLLAAVLLAAAPASSQILLRDDFDGVALDPLLWFQPEGAGTFLGRTQLRPPAYPVELSRGRARLALELYNPGPGVSFWGTEFVSQQLFSRDTGLAIRARVRLTAPQPRGLVTSLFGYRLHDPPTTRDELDFEQLTNDLDDGSERVLTNSFDDAPFSSAGDFSFEAVPGLDPTDWNELEIRWLPDAVEWHVNGALVRRELDTVPDAAMSLRANVWAPDSNFAAAYDAGLQPVADPGQNQTWWYEIDWIEVERLQPVPLLGPLGASGLAVLCLGLLAAAASRQRSRAGRSRSR